MSVRERLIYPVAVVILLAWTASMVSAVLTNHYTALTITTPVMIMLAGYVFGVQIVKGTKSNDGE